MNPYHSQRRPCTAWSMPMRIARPGRTCTLSGGDGVRSGSAQPVAFANTTWAVPIVNRSVARNLPKSMAMDWTSQVRSTHVGYVDAHFDAA